MSNTTLKQRIAQAVADFEAGRINLAGLQNTIAGNGNALEAMPYALIKELGDIEQTLTVAQWYQEEDCEVSPQEALNAIRSWLSRVPD